MEGEAATRTKRSITASHHKTTGVATHAVQPRAKKAGEPDVTNSFGDPERVAPVASRFKASSGRFDYRFPALSLTVLRWKVGK